MSCTTGLSNATPKATTEMAELHDRMLRRTFWSDPELYHWPREKRLFYVGLWSIAEDSGCFEYDGLSWKALLFPADMDLDLSTLFVWAQELEEAGKLVPYAAHGRRYGYLPNFHRHQKPTRYSAPKLPLPEWVTFAPHDREPNRGTYIHAWQPAPQADGQPAPQPAKGPEENLTEQKVTEQKVREPNSGCPPACQQPAPGEASRLAQLLVDLVKERVPKARIGVSSAEREILELLKASWSSDEIEGVIRWSQADRFWQSIIVSGDKLLQHFDALYAKQQPEGVTSDGVDTRSLEAYDNA